MNIEPPSRVRREQGASRPGGPNLEAAIFLKLSLGDQQVTQELQGRWLTLNQDKILKISDRDPQACTRKLFTQLVW